MPKVHLVKHLHGDVKQGRSLKGKSFYLSWKAAKWNKILPHIHLPPQAFIFYWRPQMVAFSPRNGTLEIKPFCKDRAATHPPGQHSLECLGRKLSQPLVGETQSLSRLSLIALSLGFRPGFDWDSSSLFCSVWLMLPIISKCSVGFLHPSSINPTVSTPTTRQKCGFISRAPWQRWSNTALFTGQPWDFLHPGLFNLFFLLDPGGFFP